MSLSSSRELTSPACPRLQATPATIAGPRRPPWTSACGSPLAALAASGWLALAIGPAHADTPPLSIYGFARMDAIIDDSRMSDAQSPLFVEPEDGGNDAAVSLHPRLTRFGLTVDDWKVAGALRGEAKLEVDFQDFPNRGAEAAPLPRLRQAYAQLRLKRLELLAGQTWDLLAPLFPAANNDTLMWNAGNVGDRRTQLRLSLLLNDRVRVAIAAAAPGVIDEQDADGDGLLDGADGAVPMLQYLVELRTIGLSGQILRYGVWGHVGRQEIAGDGVGSFSVGAHLLFPITRRLSVLGELFGGCNLADIRGGIGQGVNPVTFEPICAHGGWAEMAYVASDWYMLAAGGTVDRVASDTLEDGDRARNQTFYAVQRFRAHENLQIGLEYVHWLTRYAGGGRGAANRVNAHVTMFF